VDGTPPEPILAGESLQFPGKEVHIDYLAIDNEAFRQGPLVATPELELPGCARYLECKDTRPSYIEGQPSRS